MMEYPTTVQTATDTIALAPTLVSEERPLKRNKDSVDNRDRKVPLTQSSGLYYALATLGGIVSLGIYFLHEKS